MKKLVQYFIPKGLSTDEEAQRKARLTVGVLLIICYFTSNYSLISWLIDYPGGLISQVPLFILSVTTLILYRKGVSHSILLSFYFIFCSISIAITVYYTGGFSSKLLAWLATTPIVALLVWSKRGSVLSLITVVILEIAFFYFEQKGFVYPNQIKPEYATIFFLACNLGIVFILYWIAHVFEKAKDQALSNLQAKNIELIKEKKKSDDLLLNILPESVAEELKETGGAKAGLFENVSVLFLDIVDFTVIGENLSPQDLVNELNTCFTIFDNLITLNGMEKIKTVGDAYITVSGLPSPNMNHAEVTVNTALDMLEAVEQYGQTRKESNLPYFKFRAGIHSGALVAGIVGIKKFSYDIWGDTVNIAARMEQNGEGGRLNISSETYELIKDKFETEPRGKIEAKNKGAIDMYFVNRKRPER